MRLRIRNRRSSARTGFTLIELLIVVSIVAVLAAIAVVNFQQARRRAWKVADAANLKVIGAALQSYYMDYADLPPGDREGGPFPSHTPEFFSVMNGPAAGGSWDGLPWMLHELGYVSDWKTLFCPRYLQLYNGGTALRGDVPRYHNFRYAYNSSAVSSGGHSGGWGNLMTGETWLVRDLWLAPESGWFGGYAPEYPGDYTYPWGGGEYEGKLEQALYADLAVRTVVGGTDEEIESAM